MINKDQGLRIYILWGQKNPQKWKNFSPAACQPATSCVIFPDSFQIISVILECLFVCPSPFVICTIPLYIKEVESTRIKFLNRLTTSLSVMFSPKILFLYIVPTFKSVALKVNLLPPGGRSKKLHSSHVHSCQKLHSHWSRSCKLRSIFKIDFLIYD